MKTKLNKYSILKWGVVVIMLILVIMMPKIKESINDKKFEKMPRETVYCHFESDTKTFGINRTECKNMKIVSKELNRINLSQFDSLNYTSFFCTEELTELPDCHTENHYLSVYPLILWTNSTVDGYVCIEYQINFTEGSDERIMGYLSSFMQYAYDNQSSQRKAFNDCEWVR